METRKYFLYDRGWITVKVEDGIVFYSGEQNAGDFSKLLELIMTSQDEARIRTLSDILRWLQDLDAKIDTKEDKYVHGTEETGPQGCGNVGDGHTAADVDVLGSSKRDLAVERGDYEMPEEPPSGARVDPDDTVLRKGLSIEGLKAEGNICIINGIDRQERTPLKYIHPTLGTIDLDDILSRFIKLENDVFNLKNETSGKLRSLEEKLSPTVVVNGVRGTQAEQRLVSLLSNPPQLSYEHPTLGRINVDKEISEYFALQKKFEEFRKCFLNMEKRIEKLEDKNTVYNSTLEDFRRYTGRVESLEKMVGELYGKTSANAKAIQAAKTETDTASDVAACVDYRTTLENWGREYDITEVSEKPHIFRLPIGDDEEVLLFTEGLKFLICLPGETGFIEMEDLWWRCNHKELVPEQDYKVLCSVLDTWKTSRILGA